MIQIDLRNLTQEHVDAASKHLGKCRYTAPCIIGTLVPEDQRQRMDEANLHDNGYSPGVGLLRELNLIQFPNEEQAQAAAHLQHLFDSLAQDEFYREVQRWVDADPV